MTLSRCTVEGGIEKRVERAHFCPCSEKKLYDLWLRMIRDGLMKGSLAVKSGLLKKRLKTRQGPAPL
jgi:hypothetical protein